MQVIPIEASGNYGIRLFSGFFDYAGDGASIATLSYRVTALDAGMGINGYARFRQSDCSSGRYRNGIFIRRVFPRSICQPNW